MAVTGDSISETENPLLNDVVVPGSVDFRGRPSVRSTCGCWKSASYIIVAQMAERISFYGVSSNLMIYLMAALGQTTAAAAANLNAMYGTANLTPILGAFLADSFLGQYRTIVLSSLFYILGLGFLSVSAALNSFDSSDCRSGANYVSCSPQQFQTLFFFFSLYLVALAQGGHKPCLQAFGARQFDDEDEKESRMKSSFFNWWLWCACFGMLSAIPVLNYVQENLSWAVGFGIPCILMCSGLTVFLIGTMTYRFHGNKDWQAQPILPHECAQIESLDNALLASESDGDKKVCSTGDTEKAKVILRLVPIWCTAFGYSLVYAQPSTLFTKQAATMNRHLSSSIQLPAASLQNYFILGSIIVFLPIYDCFFVPIARAITKKPSGISMLHRIGIGLCLSLTSIVIAALVERKRRATACEYGLVDTPEAMIPMSIWWLAPQYVLSGVADVFAQIGLQEFFYDQVPGELKSMGLALYLTILGIGSLLSSFLVSAIDKATRVGGQDGWFSDNLNLAHLDYFYWLLAGINAFSLVAYVYLAKSYVHNR